MSEPTISLRAIIKDETAAQLRGMAGSLKQVSESASGATRSFGVLDAEIDKLTVSLGDQIIKLRAQKEILSDPVYRKAAEHAAQLRREVDKLNEGINSSTKATEKHGITWSEVVSKYYLASQAFGVVKNGLMSLVDAAKQYDSIRSRLNAAEGSEALGGRDFKEAQEMAKKPGLGFEQVASTMATLRGMKVTAGEAKTLILGIGQANASAAGSAEQFGRVMYQIQQSVSLGRLMAEDLRPIVQQIPTLGAAINNTFGTTDAEALNKRLKESGQSVRDFWLEVAALGKTLPANSDTIQNGLDNLGDAFVRLKAAISPSKGAISEFANWLTTKMDKFSSFWEKAGGEKALAKQAALNTGINLLRMSAADEKILANEITRIKEYEKANSLMLRAEQDAESKNAAAAAAKKRREESNEKAGEFEAKRIARHDLAPEANVITNFDGSVTLRSGTEWETQDDPEHLRNVQQAEDARERAEKAALEDRKRAQKEYTKLIQDENQKRIEFERQYWQQVQTSATSTINSIAQTLIMSGGSMKDKLRQILAQGESALISGGVNMLMGAAFAPATGGASMAMPGALGLLGSFMGMRATGGATLGPVGVGERGPEVFRPATPGTVYNSSSSHYNYSGPITVVVSGANANEVAKDLPRAIENAQRNRRQTSISR